MPPARRREVGDKPSAPSRPGEDQGSARDAPEAARGSARRRWALEFQQKLSRAARGWIGPCPAPLRMGLGWWCQLGMDVSHSRPAEMGDLSFSRSCRSTCPREDRQETFPGWPQALEAGGSWKKRDKGSAELLGNQEALPRSQIPPPRATTPILAREKPHQDTRCAPRRGCEGWRPRGRRQRLRLGTPELIPTLGGSRVGKIPSPRRTEKPFPLGGGGIVSAAVTNGRKPG